MVQNEMLSLYSIRNFKTIRLPWSLFLHIWITPWVNQCQWHRCIDLHENTVILSVHSLTCICNCFSIWLHSLEETREELEEFQISSRELECELEAQLEQLESKNKDLLSETSKLGSENSSLKVEYCSFLLIWYYIIIINY